MEIEPEDFDIPSTPTTTRSIAGPPTPTDTIVTDDIWGHITSNDAVPWAGSTFMIRERIDGRIITLERGTLRLVASVSRTGGWHWECVERDGWLGFRNSVSGTYIGHNGKGKFHAAVSHHRGHEFFCARRHPDGGYLLLMRHGDKIRKMDIGKDGEELIETENEGIAWEFVKV